MNWLAKPDVGLKVARICDLFKVLVISSLLFMKDIMGSLNINQLMLTDGTPSLTLITRTAHFVMQ